MKSHCYFSKSRTPNQIVEYFFLLKCLNSVVSTGEWQYPKAFICVDVFLLNFNYKQVPVAVYDHLWAVLQLNIPRPLSRSLSLSFLSFSLAIRSLGLTVLFAITEIDVKPSRNVVSAVAETF